MALNTDSRIPSLDGLRGIAAVVIMIFHYNNVYLPQAALRGMLPLMRPFLDHAYLAVDLFFLMSGFVMAHVYGRQLSSNLRAHWWDFTSMRFARIYPLFAATTVVMVATRAWSGLPIEAVVVWFAVTYATAIVYEVVRCWQSSGKGAIQAFFG